MRHRIQDHGKADLFPITEKPTMQRYSPPVGKFTKQQNLYFNDQYSIISVTAKEKKALDSRSNIFYEPTKCPPSPKVPKLQLTDMDHHTRMLYMSSSHLMPSYTNNFDRVKQECSSRQPINENPNLKIKLQNQNYSDLFNRECGITQSPTRKLRSFSPHQNWAAHDSIRDAKNTTNGYYTERTSPTGRNNEITRLYQQVKGNLEHYGVKDILNPKPIQPKIPVEYSGMYKWKNNYKK